MRDAEKVVDAAMDRMVRDVSIQPSDDLPRGAIRDIAGTRAFHLERARRLGRHLRVQVAIDETGWLRSEIELVFTKNPDHTLRPVKVRVGREASDEDVLARGGVVARCAQYNGEIRELRQLGERLDELVQHGRITLVPGSRVANAHRALSRLDELIAERQATCMGHGVIRLACLVREIEDVARCNALLAPIVRATERTARTTEPRDASSPQLARRWLRWVTAFVRSLTRINRVRAG